MIRLFKCFFGLGCMFLALLAPQAYHMGAGSVFNGMAIGVKTLWIPTTWATFYGVILGGLIFAYQHRALSPWLSFFSDPARVDTKDIECALRILETTQKLVLCTGIILGMMGCIALLGSLDQGIQVLGFMFATVLSHFAIAGLLVLFLVIPFRSYWSNHLSDRI